MCGQDTCAGGTRELHLLRLSEPPALHSNLLIDFRTNIRPQNRASHQNLPPRVHCNSFARTSLGGPNFPDLTEKKCPSKSQNLQLAHLNASTCRCLHTYPHDKTMATPEHIMGTRNMLCKRTFRKAVLHVEPLRADAHVRICSRHVPQHVTASAAFRQPRNVRAVHHGLPGALRPTASSFRWVPRAVVGPAAPHEGYLDGTRTSISACTCTVAKRDPLKVPVKLPH